MAEQRHRGRVRGAVVIGVVALRTRADGVGERVVTVCCGGHRAGSCCEGTKCVPCCPECPTCPVVQRREPAERAVDAAELRERQLLVRVSARRAETVGVIAGLAELAYDLERFTKAAVDVAVEDFSIRYAEQLRGDVEAQP